MKVNQLNFYDDLSYNDSYFDDPSEELELEIDELDLSDLEEEIRSIDNQGNLESYF
mgnify:CR=1 FL=1